MLQQKSYMARQSGPHIFETKGPNAPKWYIVDAKDQILGRLATLVAKVITGKHKASYTEHADAGDFLVVLNADKVALTKNKMKTKLYRDYSGYISGLKVKTAEELLQRHPTELLRRAVWGMTNKSTLARRQMKKLKLFASAEHPHTAQNPLPLPKGALRGSVLGSVKKEK